MDFYTNLTFKVQKGRGVESRDLISKFTFIASMFVNSSALSFAAYYNVRESPVASLSSQCENQGPQLPTVPIQLLPHCNRLLILCEFESFAIEGSWARKC